MNKKIVADKCLNCGAEMESSIASHMNGTAPVICEECRKTYKPTKRSLEKEKPWTYVDGDPGSPKGKGKCPKCGSKNMRYTDEWEKCLDCRTWWTWN